MIEPRELQAEDSVSHLPSPKGYLEMEEELSIIM